MCWCSSFKDVKTNPAELEGNTLELQVVPSPAIDQSGWVWGPVQCSVLVAYMGNVHKACVCVCTCVVVFLLNQ